MNLWTGDIWAGTYHLYNAFEWYTREYPMSHLYFLGIHKPLGKCVYQENTSDNWDIPWYTTRKCCITILYHAIIRQYTE